MAYRHWLVDIRKEKKISKRVAADKIGCRPCDYSDVEFGRNSEKELLEKIADYYGFDVSMFEEKDRECTEQNPLSDSMKKFITTMEAEAEAFRKAGLEVGRVEYTCPHCGGIAVANRYRHGGRIHGLGSGCDTCGIRHT